MTEIGLSTLRRFTDHVLHNLYNILLSVVKTNVTFGNSKPKPSKKALPNMEPAVYLRKQWHKSAILSDLHGKIIPYSESYSKHKKEKPQRMDVMLVVWPGIAISRRNDFLEELELVEVEDDEMSSAEDGHQHTKAAKEQRVKWAAERPPCAQAQKGKEVHGRGEGGQHDACRTTQRTIKFWSSIQIN